MSPSDMQSGVDACWRWALLNNARIAAISMSESLYDQRGSDQPQWEQASSKAASAGALFVAAVGNQPGAELVAPISVGSVVSVGAGDPNGMACAFSPPLAVTVIIGPGCAGDRSWQRGSSSAAAATTAVIAALAARSPLKSRDALQMQLKSSFVIAPNGGPILDGRALASGDFAGLHRPREAPVPSAGISAPGVHVVPPNDSSVRVLLWRPKVRATVRGRRLRVTRRTHRSEGRMVVEFRDRGRQRQRTTLRASLTIPVGARPKRVRVWVESKTPGQWRSLSTRSSVG